LYCAAFNEALAPQRIFLLFLAPHFGSFIFHANILWCTEKVQVNCCEIECPELAVVSAILAEKSSQKFWQPHFPGRNSEDTIFWCEKMRPEHVPIFSSLQSNPPPCGGCFLHRTIFFLVFVDLLETRNRKTRPRPGQTLAFGQVGPAQHRGWRRRCRHNICRQAASLSRLAWAVWMTRFRAAPATRGRASRVQCCSLQGAPARARC
jgi:hypothetical protein